MSDRRLLHNKSKSDTIHLGTLPKKILKQYWKHYKVSYLHRLKISLPWYEGLTPCLTVPSKDGRLSVNSVKVCYVYQLVAWRTFGGEMMKQIAAAKKADDLTISHVCGTKLCCNCLHLIIESKRINDERVHCHFCMRLIFDKKGLAGLEAFWKLGGCPHKPPCVTLADDVYTFSE
jgi:hypothetical protein